jgi:hypothetical protein
MPDEQEQVGVDIPAEEIEVLHAVAEEREPHGEPPRSRSRGHWRRRSGGR